MNSLVSMKDLTPLGIETIGGRHVLLMNRDDGGVDLEIRITKGGHNLVGKCTIGADRRDIMARFLATENTGRQEERPTHRPAHHHRPGITTER